MRQTSKDRRQSVSSLNAPAYRVGHNNRGTATQATERRSDKTDTANQDTYGLS